MTAINTEYEHSQGSHSSAPDYWSVSFGLRMLGDRWSMLIVRELLTGEAGFNALARSLSECSRTLLSNRLKRLQHHGIVEQDSESGPHGTRLYRLTKVGEGLRGTLEALGGWSKNWYAPYENDVESGLRTLVGQMGRSLVAAKLPKPTFHIEFKFQDGSRIHHARIVTNYGRTISDIGPAHDNFDLVVHVEPTILHDLWWGTRQCEVARQRGDIGFTGADGYSEEFSSWFTAPSAEF